MGEGTFKTSETRLELTIEAELRSLRTYGDSFWEEVVQRAGARILSHISNKFSNAYLLAESSLFVFDSRILMLTCGDTRIIDGTRFLLRYLRPENIEALVYERRSMDISRQHHVKMDEEVRGLQEILTTRDRSRGNFGRVSMTPPVSSFAYQKNEDDLIQSQNLQILMRDFVDPLPQILSSCDPSRAEIHDLLGLREAIAGYTVDDYVFDPPGFSLNAIKDHLYFTVHVSLDDERNYASFETNSFTGTSASIFIRSILDVLRPKEYWDNLHSHERQIRTAHSI